MRELWSRRRADRARPLLICGRFLPANTVALIHGMRSDRLAKKVDAYRVALIDQLFAERGGRDAVDVAGRIAIENYALVSAQHKTIEERLDHDGLFTQTGRRRSAFDMLRSISETIERLRAQLPPIATRDGLDLSDATTEQLIERTATILRTLLEQRDAEARVAEARAAAFQDVALAPSVQDSTGSSPSRAPTSALEPQRCPYCHQPPASVQHHAYDVLHLDDPEQIKRRADRATAEMAESISRAGGRPPTIRTREVPGDEYSHLLPADAERERRMKAERIRREWESPSGLGILKT